jgi:hypothetical protein
VLEICVGGAGMARVPHQIRVAMDLSLTDADLLALMCDELHFPGDSSMWAMPLPDAAEASTGSLSLQEHTSGSSSDSATSFEHLQHLTREDPLLFDSDTAGTSFPTRQLAAPSSDWWPEPAFEQPASASASAFEQPASSATPAPVSASASARVSTPPAAGSSATPTRKKRSSSTTDTPLVASYKRRYRPLSPLADDDDFVSGGEGTDDDEYDPRDRTPRLSRRRHPGRPALPHGLEPHSTVGPARALLKHVADNYDLHDDSLLQFVQWLESPRCRSKRAAATFPGWSRDGPDLLARHDTQQKLVLRELAVQLLEHYASSSRAEVLRKADAPPGQRDWKKQHVGSIVRLVCEANRQRGVETRIPNVRI